MDRVTNIMVGGKEGSLEDLKAADEVRANFQEKDGRRITTNLDISESGQAGMGSLPAPIEPSLRRWSGDARFLQEAADAWDRHDKCLAGHGDVYRVRAGLVFDRD